MHLPLLVGRLLRSGFRRGRGRGLGLRCRLFHGSLCDLFGNRLRRLLELPNSLTQAAAQFGQFLGSENDESSNHNHQQFRKPDVFKEGTSLPSKFLLASAYCPGPQKSRHVIRTMPGYRATWHDMARSPLWAATCGTNRARMGNSAASNRMLQTSDGRDGQEERKRYRTITAIHHENYSCIGVGSGLVMSFLHHALFPIYMKIRG